MDEAGPSGLSYKKKRKTPIIGDENILQELYDNSGSDLEDLSDSDPEYEPHNAANNCTNNNSSSSSSSLSSSESENEQDNLMQFTLPNSNINRASPQRQQGRIRANRGQRRQGRNRMGPGRQENRMNVNYPEDAQLGWEMNDILLQIPGYNTTPGISETFQITNESTAYEIFSIFFDDAMFENIKFQTNKYARDRIDKELKKNNLKPRTLLSNWKAVTNSEMKIFFSIIIHMSLVVKPTLKHYWALSAIYASKFCKLVGMSRDRFLSILSMLHMNDNSTYKPRGDPGHDPLHKIRPIHDHLLNLYKIIYTPEENITIDEGICPFRGRLRFRVYIKGKPHKYGIKLYMVCEVQSGFCSNFEIYTGAIITDQEEDYKTINSLVQRLLVPYENKGYCVYLDRYFAGPVLFDTLWAKKLKAVGTVMANRKGMPKKAFKKYKLRVGEFIFRRRQHLLALKWKDKRDVNILSTIHKAEMLPAPTYHPEGPPRMKPSAILSYNKNKVGVDRSDQLLSYNSFKRKSIKWWKKLFFHLFDLTILNSQILYNKSHPNSKMNMLKFYEQICNSLLAAAGVHIDEDEEGDPPGDTGNLRLVGKNHFPVYVPETASKGEGQAYRPCKVCSETGKYLTGKRKRVDTRYMCERCQTALCVVPCFKKFHSMANYWK